MSKIYKISEFANKVGCGISSLRLWDRNGKFKAKRTVADQRYYTEEDVRKFLNLKRDVTRKTVVYARVSSSSQKKDLANQIERLEEFCSAKGYTVDDWVSEIAGGMNFKRKKFLKVTDGISNGDISRLVIAHKDRLTRFGFEYFQHICESNDCELVVLNQESLSPQEEMLQDLLSIVHTFSCRLYGLRNYKKDLKKALK